MKITVITVCLNVGEDLKATVNSVLNQTYQNLEYWVIDGGSTDNSRQILESYGSKLNFISEKDSGTYNAMNKGIGFASGQYIIFLNGGDYFRSNDVLDFMIQHSSREDIIYGDIAFVSPVQETEIKYPDKLQFSFFLRDTIPHPCTLIKKELFQKLGLYNESIKICADWAFFLDAIVKFSCSYKHVDKFITAFLLGGLSSRPESILQIKLEKDSYLDSNYKLLLEDYKELELFKKKFDSLQRSRVINFVTRFLPKRFRHLIYEN